MSEPTGLEPAKLDLDFGITAARWRAGHLSFREVEDFATLALMRDFDGPALRELAWRHDSWQEIDPLFIQALGEMEMAVPSESEAIVLVAEAIAQDIQTGHKGMLEAAREIVRLYYPLLYDTEPFDREQFDPGHLDLLLDDWEYQVEQRPEIENQIATLLSRLLESPQQIRPREQADLAPALGGRHAPEEPSPDEPEPERARLAFHFEFALGRYFRWRWPWSR